MIVDGDAAAAERIAAAFDRIGWQATACDPALAVQHILRHRPDEAALTLLGELKDAHRPSRALVVLTAPRVELAVAAVRAGAAEVLVAPVGAEKILQALEAYRRRRETEDLRLGVLTDNAIADAI